MKQPLTLLVVLGLLFAHCHQSGPSPTKSEDQLPPATQTGQHTFGYLLSGWPWTLAAMWVRSTTVLLYDLGYAGGDLEIRAYRYIDALQDAQYSIITRALVVKTGIPI